MLTADLALVMLINHLSAYYQAHTPTYMTYVERMHITAASLGRSQDINRSVAVRVADNYAVMKDLPNGEERTGQAFPVIASFDPFSQFKFGYFANPKRVDITLVQGTLWYFKTPDPDPGVNVVVPYSSYWAARYASDSTATALHLLIDPTPRVTNGFYPSEVEEDATTQLPRHIEMREVGGDMAFALDYSVIDGYWVLTHGTFSATQHVAFVTFKVVADVTFSDITFPTEAPDPRLAGSPTPSPVPSTAPSPKG
jgi:hypothetical protein